MEEEGEEVRDVVEGAAVVMIVIVVVVVVADADAVEEVRAQEAGPPTLPRATRHLI